MQVRDLGVLPYRDAWRLQEEAHAAVLAGGEEQLLLVEHPPVITFGRRGVTAQFLRASEAMLADKGVEIVESDRGGDVTFHGPGQLVAYPIVRLADHALSVSAYVHGLERLLIAALADFGIKGQSDPTAVGVWVNGPRGLAKIAAIGVRIRRGVSLHGLALNVTTDLKFFDLIVPCGLMGRPVTSMREMLGNACPTMAEMQAGLSRRMLSDLSRPVTSNSTGKGL